MIPFIDQDRLLAAARSVPPGSLTEEERQRNTLGDIIVFSHAPGEHVCGCAPDMQAADSRRGLGEARSLGAGAASPSRCTCASNWSASPAPPTVRLRNCYLRPAVHNAGGAGETTYCQTTLPAHFASVTSSNSRAVSQAAPPPLPSGDRGFVPSVRRGGGTSHRGVALHAQAATGLHVRVRIVSLNFAPPIPAVPQFVQGTKTGASGPAGFPSLATIKSTSEGPQHAQHAAAARKPCRQR